MTASALAHAVDELRLLELQRRDVDRDRALAAPLAPQRRLAHRLRQHPVADGDDEAAVLGHRDEAARRLTSPISGSRQRISASAPIERAVVMRTCGW